MFWPVGTNKHGPSHEQFLVVVPWHTKGLPLQLLQYNLFQMSIGIQYREIVWQQLQQIPGKLLLQYSMQNATNPRKS